MAITVFLSRSPGLLNQGADGPLCWVLVLSTASYLQLTDFLSSPRLYNCSTPTFLLWASQITLNSTCPWSRLYPDIPRPDAPVIYTGAFSILTAWLGRRSVCNTMLLNSTKPNHIYLIYMYKEDLALNNLQWLICRKTQLNQIIYI